MIRFDDSNLLSYKLNEHGHYAFPKIFSVGGVSWTWDPSMEAVNCKMKLTNSKFILDNILGYNNFIWTKKGVIIDVEIWVIETYYHFRSSHPEVFLEKGVLKNMQQFTGEYPCRGAISIKLQSSFIEITLRHGCSPVNSLLIFRTPFSKNTSWWQLLLLIEITFDIPDLYC